MAFDPRNVNKYPPDLHHPHNMPPYSYPSHPHLSHPNHLLSHQNHQNHPSHQVIQPVHRTDENRNENRCGNKEMCPTISQESTSSRSIQKVDAATMTDPLSIDFRLTSEYLARCSNTLGLPYVCKYDDNSNTNSSMHNCPDSHSKIEYDLQPQRINGHLVYSCPECAYRFEDRETLQEHLEDHKSRSHMCDTYKDRLYQCNTCCKNFKRKEHLDRHKLGHNKDRLYQCNTCCKDFLRNDHLVRHMVTHSGSKNHVCTECGKAFFRKDHLKKHLLSHGNQIGSSKSKSSSSSHSGPSMGPNNDEGLSTFAMMMRQAGPPPFSILRT